MHLTPKTYSMQDLQGSSLPYGTFQPSHRQHIVEGIFADIPLTKSNVYSQQTSRYYSKSIETTENGMFLQESSLPFVKLTSPHGSFDAFVLDSTNSLGQNCRLVSILDKQDSTSINDINEYNKRGREEQQNDEHSITQGYLHLCIKTEDKIHNLGNINSLVVSAHGSQSQDFKQAFMLPKDKSLMFYGPNHFSVTLLTYLNNNHIYSKISYWNDELRVELFENSLSEHKIVNYLAANFAGVVEINQKFYVRNIELEATHNENIDNLINKSDYEITIIKELSLFQELHKAAEPSQPKARYSIGNDYIQDLGSLIYYNLPIFTSLGFKPKNIVVEACRSNPHIINPHSGQPFDYTPSKLNQSNHIKEQISREDQFDHLSVPHRTIILPNK